MIVFFKLQLNYQIKSMNYILPASLRDTGLTMIMFMLVPFVNVFFAAVYGLAFLWAFIRVGRFFAIILMLVLGVIYLFLYYYLPFVAISHIKSNNINAMIGYGLAFIWMIAIYFYARNLIFWGLFVTFSNCQETIDRAAELLKRKVIDFQFGFTPAVGISIPQRRIHFVYADAVIDYDFDDVIDFKYTYVEVSDNRGNLSNKEVQIEFSMRDFERPKISVKMFSLQEAKNTVDRISLIMKSPDRYHKSSRNVTIF